MHGARRLNRTVLVVIWCVAILVSVLGGSWRTPTSDDPQWKVDSQLPGSFVVLYLGWFLGPLQIIMSPPVVSVLTILTNALCYYSIVRGVLFFRGNRRAGDTRTETDDGDSSPRSE